MKKIIKNNIFGFILGIILCSGIVYGVNLYKSEDIQYQPSDESWNVSNVSDALNDLYENNDESISKTLVATDVTASGSQHTATVDCTEVNNYQELTAADFYLDMKSFKMQWKGTSGPHTLSRQWDLNYDSESGTLTIKYFYIIVSLGDDLYGKVWPIVDIYIIK